MEVGKGEIDGDLTWGGEQTLLGGVNTQYSVQMLCF